MNNVTKTLENLPNTLIMTPKQENLHIQKMETM